MNQHCVQRRLDSLFMFAVGMCLKCTHTSQGFIQGGGGWGIWPPLAGHN